MNFMNDMMNIKIKKIIDYQNNQFQMTLNRLNDQIEKMHSKLYKFTSFVIFAFFAFFASSTFAFFAFSTFFAHIDHERFIFLLTLF